MSSRPSHPHDPPDGSFILAPPARVRVDPPMTEAQRARAVAHIDDLLAHLSDPLPDGEPDWDVHALFPPDRAP